MRAWIAATFLILSGCGGALSPLPDYNAGVALFNTVCGLEFLTTSTTCYHLTVVAGAASLTPVADGSYTNGSCTYVVLNQKVSAQ